MFTRFSHFHGTQGPIVSRTHDTAQSLAVPGRPGPC